VLLEDRRGAYRALEAMDLMRSDHAAKRVEGFSIIFVIVGQRLEPPLHLLGGVGGIDDGSLSRRECRARRGGTRATFEVPAPLLDFVLLPFGVTMPVDHVRSLAANR